MQHKNTAFLNQRYSDIRFSPIVLVPEGSNRLLFTVQNNVFANENKIAANDIYLLLTVYVQCFCTPIFTFVLNILSRYEKSIWGKCDENTLIYSSVNKSCVENKDYLSIISILLKEQIEFDLIYRHQFWKTVSL